MSATNTFFHQDLSQVLQPLNMSTRDDKNNIMIMINSGIKEISFEFTIPTDAYPSYNGKCATIEYNVKGTADHDNWIDKNKIAKFLAINSKHKTKHNITDEINDDNVVTGNNNSNHVYHIKGPQNNFFIKNIN
jgi:hypothetical protein